MLGKKKVAIICLILACVIVVPIFAYMYFYKTKPTVIWQTHPTQTIKKTVKIVEITVKIQDIETGEISNVEMDKFEGQEMVQRVLMRYAEQFTKEAKNVEIIIRPIGEQVFELTINILK